MMKILKIIGIFILFVGVGIGLERFLNKNGEWVSPLASGFWNKQTDEKKDQEKSKEMIKKADLVLLVIDGSKETKVIKIAVVK